MANSSHVHEGTQDNFEELVLRSASEIPVVVDFWAPWCQPCRTLTPVLEKLADEFGGRFQLVKVNTDEQQALAGQFGIRSLPTVAVFRDGQIVDEFMGAQPESAVRRFLEPHVPRLSDEARQRAAALRSGGDVEGAMQLLRETMQADPDNPRLKFDLARLLIDEDHLQEAEETLHSLPFVQREDEPAKSLLTEVQFRRKAMESGVVDVEALKEAITQAPDNLTARSQLAAQLVVAHDFDDALEQYLEIMKRDRRFEDDAGRKGLLDIFELLDDDDPRLATYRRRMAALLN